MILLIGVITPFTTGAHLVIFPFGKVVGESCPSPGLISEFSTPVAWGSQTSPVISPVETDTFDLPKRP